MADEMLRIAGRADNGSAKALTVEIDSDGNGVLRTVDAAPFAYDPVNDAKNVNIKAQHRMIKKDIRDSTPVTASGGSRTTTIIPPAGKVWNLKYLAVICPTISGATSGIHQITVRYGWNSSHNNLIYGASNFDKAVEYMNNIFAAGVTTKTPSNELLQKGNLQDLVISADVPLYVVYENKTNADQTGQCFVYYVVSEEDEL